MGRWRVFLFLGLALWAMTVPVLAAELPADVENALPRDAGRLLDGVYARRTERQDLLFTVFP